MTSDTVAFVIPAYRSAHLGRTLHSLAAQTDHRFTVYVGDDASQDDIRSVIFPYSETLGIQYVRFETNAGLESLYLQLRRCLALTQGESWICFLSDDNELTPRAVSRLHRCMARHPETDVFHWNADVIDPAGNVTGKLRRFPGSLSVEQLFRQVYGRGESAPLSGFVFRREALVSALPEGETDIYRKDGVLILKAAERNGVRTVPWSRLLWRRHGAGISSNPATDEKVILSDLAFLRWTESFFGENHPLDERALIRLFARKAAELYPSYSLDEIKEICFRAAVFSGNRQVRRGTRDLKEFIEKREEKLKR